MRWHPHLTCSLIVHMDLLMSLMCLLSEHICRWYGAKNLQRCSNSLSPQKLVIMKPLSLYLVFTCFNPDIVSDFPLLLHAWTNLKSIFLDLVCRKGLPLTTKNPMSRSTLWWCLATRGRKGILVMVLWYSGLFMIAFPFMVGIWGPYMASALLVSFLVIGQFLIWFFWTEYFKVCVYGHTINWWIIIASSDPLFSRLWNRDLLLSTVLRKV